MYLFNACAGSDRFSGLDCPTVASISSSPDHFASYTRLAHSFSSAFVGRWPIADRFGNLHYKGPIGNRPQVGNLPHLVFWGFFDLSIIRTSMRSLVDSTFRPNCCWIAS